MTSEEALGNKLVRQNQELTVVFEYNCWNCYIWSVIVTVIDGIYKISDLEGSGGKVGILSWVKVYLPNWVSNFDSEP